MSLRRFVPALLALALPVPALAQGIIVAPHLVHIDHRLRSGQLILLNPGTRPVEVEVSTVFGYPGTDSTGRVVLVTEPEPGPDRPSAAGWIQAYPRRTTVPPGERQVVRLLARPPAGLPDGEYWTRLVVAAREAPPPPAPADSAPEGVTIGLSLEVRTILALIYRKGAVTGGVSVRALPAEVRGDSLAFGVALERAGTAAWLGMLRTELRDSAGALRARDSSQLAVYYPMTPRYRLPVAGLPPGRYRVRLTLDVERDDVPPEVRLPLPPVHDSLDVTIP
ncbi:MAG TPA: hypothetical protein VJ773_07520 [Gemmatimonadales bacterium]|nr:hypothetical protein [Gemmatimonadales bacterium]